jgi:hypothetical protein
MVIVMDMSTGHIEKLGAEVAAAEEFGAFVDEVLNAGWLPQPELAVQLRSVHEESGSLRAAAVEPEEFMRKLYLYQE